MGWKTLKTAYNIQHMVSVEADSIWIGSGHAPDLISISCKTGALTVSEANVGFLNRTYPQLAAATPLELLGCIHTRDEFESAITVFTFVGSKILVKQCETLGWPNVTHDGEVMYENTFSTDKQTVIDWAKSEAKLNVNFARQHRERLRKQLACAEVALETAISVADKLDADYPGSHEED